MSESLPAVPIERATLELAVIGNCTISALVDARARIVWCCMPRFDGDPVFIALLDSARGIGRDGTMAVELEDFVRSEQRYDHATAILRTQLFDSAGTGIEVTDFAPRFLRRDRVFRPAQLVRRVRPLAGHPRVRFIVRPRSDWGATEPARTRGSNHLRFVGTNQTMRARSSIRALIAQLPMTARFSVASVRGAADNEVVLDGDAAVWSAPRRSRRILRARFLGRPKGSRGGERCFPSRARPHGSCSTPRTGSRSS